MRFTTRRSSTCFFTRALASGSRERSRAEPALAALRPTGNRSKNEYRRGRLYLGLQVYRMGMLASDMREPPGADPGTTGATDHAPPRHHPHFCGSAIFDCLRRNHPANPPHRLHPHRPLNPTRQARCLGSIQTGLRRRGYRTSPARAALCSRVGDTHASAFRKSPTCGDFCQP
jgi:hypothetical protein